MSALATSGAIEQSIAQHATDPFLVLLTIAHDDLPAPIRIVRNYEAITSRGEVFQAYPFELDLPGDGDGLPEARLKIANVDRRIGHALESIATPADCTIELVLASDPDTVERAWAGLGFTTATWTAATVQISLSHLAYWDEPWPRKSVRPRGFPGLFP